MKKRECRKCGLEKDIIDFKKYKRKSGEYAFQFICIVCHKIDAKKYREKIKDKASEYAKQWRLKNKELKKIADKNWYEKNIRTVSK